MNKDKIINRNNTNLYNNRKLVLESFLDGKINSSGGVMDIFDLEIYDYGSVSFSRKLERASSRSIIDQQIELSKYQIECLELLEENDLFISAPTSFGKTFLAFEYIKRHEDTLNNVLFIVPTIALMNELFKKLSTIFGEKYNIILNDYEISDEDVNSKNIFVLVPERTRGDKFNQLLLEVKLDLCIYDEIYKLSRKRKQDHDDDRLIIMNFVYSNMLQKAEKILLLGPFIKCLNFLNTNREIVQYITDYTPVLNEISVCPNYNWLEDYTAEKRLIYFSTPSKIQKEILDLSLDDYSNKAPNDEVNEIVQWIKDNVYENWYYIPLLKQGIGIHHGKTPLYLRNYFENSFRNEKFIHTIICTSTLMEGINTPTNKLIIIDCPENAFELNNLIGRVARLNIRNPIKGEIISLKEIDTGTLYNADEWDEITLLYDDNSQISNEDEYLYLNKADESERYDSYLRFIKKLGEDYSISIDDIMKSGIRFKVIKDFIEKDVLKTLISYLEQDEYKNIDIIDILIKCIPFRSVTQYFLRERYKSIRTKINVKGEVINCLSMKTPMKIMMDQNNIKSIITYFINSELPSSYDINQYVDALLELDNFIRFKFSQSISLLDLFANAFSEEQNKKLKKFIDMVMNFVGKDERLRKVLLDLGIPTEDCSTIEVMLNEIGLKTNHKSSHVMKMIKELKTHIRFNELSPFSKKIIMS